MARREEGGGEGRGGKGRGWGGEGGGRGWKVREGGEKGEWERREEEMAEVGGRFMQLIFFSRTYMYDSQFLYMCMHMYIAYTVHVYMHSKCNIGRSISHTFTCIYQLSTGSTTAHLAGVWYPDGAWEEESSREQLPHPLEAVH